MSFHMHRYCYFSAGAAGSIVMVSHGCGITGVILHSPRGIYQLEWGLDRSGFGDQILEMLCVCCRT